MAGKYCGMTQANTRGIKAQTIKNNKKNLKDLDLKNQPAKKATNKLKGKAHKILKLSPVTL